MLAYEHLIYNLRALILFILKDTGDIIMFDPKFTLQNLQHGHRSCAQTTKHMGSIDLDRLAPLQVCYSNMCSPLAP